MSTPARDVLRIDNLSAAFFTKEGVVRAVNGVNLALKENSIMALVGESGCGKSATALATMGLLPYPGQITEGHVFLNGTDLTTMKPDQIRHIRGREIGMVFQDPMSSLNPSTTIGSQVEEVLLAHTNATNQEARIWAQELLTEMGLPDANRLLQRYAFQLSGGMRQRVMMAIALALRPKVLIADEPTSNLDTTLQASILNHLQRLKEEYGTTILLITHDMGIVAQMADEVAVMYAGAVVEHTDTASLFQKPAHPYTFGLFQAIPRLDHADRQLRAMPGRPPTLLDLPEECPFLRRCFKATNVCRSSPKPLLRFIESGHQVACFNEMRQVR